MVQPPRKSRCRRFSISGQNRQQKMKQILILYHHFYPLQRKPPMTTFIVGCVGLNRRKLWHPVSPFRSATSCIHCLRNRVQKEAYYLSHVRGFTTEETGGHGSLIELIQPDDEIKARLHDDIYFRFEERSVSVENKLRDLRLWFDRHIFLLAVVIVIFFVLCAYFAR